MRKWIAIALAVLALFLFSGIAEDNAEKVWVKPFAELLSEYPDACFYMVQDIDRDNMPELFLMFGETDEDSKVRIYDYQNEQAVEIYETSAAKSLFAGSNPGEYGFYQQVVRNGMETVYYIEYYNGKIYTQTIYSLQNVKEYADLEMIPQFAMDDREGLEWTGNPVNENDKIIYDIFLSTFYSLGDPVQDFTVTTIDDEVISLYGLLEDHDAVLINFFFVGCQWCEKEFPYLEAAYQSYEDRIAVLALSPYDSNQSINSYREQFGLTFPMAMDNVLFTNRMKVQGFPTSILIDKKGVYRYKMSTVMQSGVFEDLFESFLISHDEDWTLEMRFTDDNGSPVPNVMASICSSEQCSMVFSDADGRIRCDAEEEEYTVHILSVPDKYEMIGQTEYVLNADQSEIQVVLNGK